MALCKICLWSFLVFCLFYLKYILDLALYSQRLIISLYIISLKMFIIIWLVMCVHICVCVNDYLIVVCVCLYSLGSFILPTTYIWGLCSAVIHWILERVSHIHYFSEQYINSWNPFLPVPLVRSYFCDLIKKMTEHLVVVLP